MDRPIDLSVIVPAYNESRLIEGTVRAALRARRAYEQQTGLGCEIVVVDNGSRDGTREILAKFALRGDIRVHDCRRRGAARARNDGAAIAKGRTLVFVDADTWIEPAGLPLVQRRLDECGRVAGFARLEALDGGLRAYCWWRFWSTVRRLPISRAKAMPALMFCTRKAFEELGPFDEAVGIGEEWPILAGAYRRNASSVVFERRFCGRTSSRRMELQRMGYARTLLKWAWAVGSLRGRLNYSTEIR